MVEYNNGFITALALFYGHRSDVFYGKSESLAVALDHLREMQLPKNLNPKLAKRIRAFRTKAFYSALHNEPRDKQLEIFDECVKLFKAIDRKYFGLKVEVRHP